MTTEAVLGSLTAILALMSIIISMFSLTRERRNEKRYDDELEQIKRDVMLNEENIKRTLNSNLIEQMAAINNALLQFDVPFPSKSLEDLDEREKQQASKAIIMMYHQITLFYQAFSNKPYLSADEWKRYVGWFKNTVLPNAIMHNPHTKSVYEAQIKSGKDLYATDFVNYLQSDF